MSRPILLEPEAAVVGGSVAEEPTQVLVRDGVIEAVGAGIDRDAGDCARVTVAGTLLPGLIDLQVNGAGGRSVDEADAGALDTIARAVRQGGAAAFLPTLITAPFPRLLEQLAAVAAWIETGGPGDGAEPLGVHLEGPFLEVAGAHDDRLFLDPTAERVDAVLDAARGRLRLVTLACGREGAADATRRFRDAGVAVAIGHARSTAGFAECVDRGAGLVTHLFNAMGSFHHRQPGIAGLALDTQAVRCSMIVDGVHVDPVWVRNAARCLGPDRTVLVTDSASPAGMPDGDYELSGIPISCRRGVVRNRDGTLAGSALTMARAVRNFLEFVGGGIEIVARVASRNPALVLETPELGDIALGCRASFARVGDAGELQAFVPPTA